MSPSKIIHLHVCLGDEIAILNGGLLGQVGKLDNIILKPDNNYVAAFVAVINKSRVLCTKTIMTNLASHYAYDYYSLRWVFFIYII